MTEKSGIQSQVEHLNMRYTGTGTADTSKWEYATNVQRDALASHIGHHSRMVYLATAQNESIFRLKHDMILKMVQPCGPPYKPKKG